VDAAGKHLPEILVLFAQKILRLQKLPGFSNKNGGTMEILYDFIGI
jgi:hypothetical protein